MRLSDRLLPDQEALERPPRIVGEMDHCTVPASLSTMGSSLRPKAGLSEGGQGNRFARFRVGRLSDTRPGRPAGVHMLDFVDFVGK